MSPDGRNCSFLVALADADYMKAVPLDQLEEVQRNVAARTKPIHRQRMALEDDRISSHELPSLGLCATEQSLDLLMMLVVAVCECVETAAIDKGSSHALRRGM
jgi:hypothetical protein